MKIRNGFVSNSSSTAFVITNTTDKEKTLVDLVEETPWIIEDFKEEYEYQDNPNFTQKKLLKSAKENNIIFKSHEEQLCIFGDEQGTLIGEVYDYMLRGEEISEFGRIMKKLKKEEKEEKIEEPTEKKQIKFTEEERVQLLNVLRQRSHEKPCFSGIRCPSFKIEFQEFLR